MISHLFGERRCYRTLATSVTILLCVVYGGSMLIGCAGSSATSGSYLYTDATHVEFLAWKEGSGQGQITGQWNTVSYHLPVSGKSQPAISPLVSLSGTVKDQTVQLSGNTLSFNGTISDKVLKIRSTAPSGQLGDQTWVPASQQEYNDLVAAFKTSIQLQGRLTDLSNVVTYPPNDSNPSLLDYAVSQAQLYINLLKTKVGNLQAAPTHAHQCQQVDLLAQYYPVAPQTFQLSYEPAQSTLAQDLAAI